MTRWYPITLGVLMAMLVGASLVADAAGVLDGIPGWVQFAAGVAFFWLASCAAGWADRRALARRTT